jgi:hypothetical protein
MPTPTHVNAIDPVGRSRLDTCIYMNQSLSTYVLLLQFATYTSKATLLEHTTETPAP